MVESGFTTVRLMIRVISSPRERSFAVFAAQDDRERGIWMKDSAPTLTRPLL